MPPKMRNNVDTVESSSLSSHTPSIRRDSSGHPDSSKRQPDHSGLVNISYTPSYFETCLQLTSAVVTGLALQCGQKRDLNSSSKEPMIIDNRSIGHNEERTEDFQLNIWMLKDVVVLKLAIHDIRQLESVTVLITLKRV
ncbi:hypothetical protein Tco_0498669 [Tanacetum coccineum]